MCAPVARSARRTPRSGRRRQRFSCGRRAHNTAHERSPSPLPPTADRDRGGARREHNFPPRARLEWDGNTQNHWTHSQTASIAGSEHQTETPYCRSHHASVPRSFIPIAVRQDMRLPLLLTGHLGLGVGERFLYKYDFTDGWQHDVRIERVLPVDPKRATRRALAGGAQCRQRTVVGRGRFWNCTSATRSSASPISSWSWSNDAWSSGARQSFTTTTKTSCSCCTGWRSIASTVALSTGVWRNTLWSLTLGAPRE